jgi:hypothetical protein
MYAKRVLFHYPGLAYFVSLWKLRASIGLVPCVMVTRSIVVHWDGAWSASHPWSAVLSAVLGQVRTGRKSIIYRRATSARTEPYPTLLYPTLTYPALPCSVLLYLCVCVSLLSVSDLTYLSPFVPLSLCYCRMESRPSILQPFMAIPRPVRSFSSRERTSPRRPM